jgi:hypothetical protein
MPSSCAASDLIRAHIETRHRCPGSSAPVDVDTAIDVILAPLLMHGDLALFAGRLLRHAARRQMYLHTHLDLVLNGLANPDQPGKGKPPK